MNIKDKIYYENNDIITVKNIPCFDPYLSADCGQAFRWSVDENNILSGIVDGRIVTIKKVNENEYQFFCDKEFFENTLIKYFDLERDYEKIVSLYNEKHLKESVKKFYGIRILKQDEWETLCSFIISQNNNIPRIKGIISRLCENYGEKIEEGCYSFPTAETISALTVEDLAPLRAGFRAKYILDAAQKVASGEVDFEKIKNGTLEDGETELIKIKGVGKKVAQCTLLFGFGKLNAFPVDVWIKRILDEHYPEGLPECVNGTEGIAQQYLFMDAIS